MDDSELLAGYIRSGSQEHFATLVNRHVNWVHAICRRHAGDNLAEDVTQAVFATLARKAGRLPKDTSITGWLFITARYASATARKIERRRHKHERRAAAMNPVHTPAPTDHDWQQILPQLDDAVARLSESDRRAILLRFYQGLSHQDTAALLGISPVAAQRRLSRAVEKLRARLQHIPLILIPSTFEEALHNHLVTTAPPHVVATSISVASAAPSAQAALIMKGTLIMKLLHNLKLIGIAASILAVTSMGIWLILPAHAASPAPAATQPAPAMKVGTIEFHIVADAATVQLPDLNKMKARLQTNGTGPLPQPGDTIHWVEVEHTEDFDRRGVTETQEWNGRHYIPVLVMSDASMNQSSMPRWSFADAHPSQDGKAVVFSFDDRGGRLFGDLTTRWYKLVSQRNDLPNPHARLAIILDNKIISAPNINSPITGGSGMIEGGGKGGFTESERDRLIHAMNAGIAPPTTEHSSDANPSIPGN